MSPWLLSIEGTPAGHDLALVLALIAALLHAILAALQKGRHDPWLSRGAIDLSYGLMAAPLALWVVPWPEPHLWPILAGAVVIHTVYKLLMASALSRGAFTVVYPVVRGTAPLFAVIGASLVFQEHFTAVQWAGVAVLLGGILGVARVNLRYQQIQRETLTPALALAVLTGLLVALYTTYDAYGIRATRDPFTFLAWFFCLDGVVFPILAARRWWRMEARPALGPLALRGVSGALVAFVSFGAIMIATRLDLVGRAAVLRETSSVFAALIGWLFLGERVGPLRLSLIGCIALGAVIVEIGG